MEKFTQITSVPTPLDRANVDTDAIIPKQFLKSIHRSGFGVNLFDEWRYLDAGEIGKDNNKRPLDKDFVLNNPKYSGSQILLARENFGCGSSREHAPWALLDYGFKVIIAPSFADIFYNNCFKNGILPIMQNNDIMNELFTQESLTINLEIQKIISANHAWSFKIDSERKHRLLEGLDDIGITLRYQDNIKEFESEYLKKYSWMR